MASEVFEVKNMKTGQIHTVTEGHFSLTDPSYVLILPEESESKSVVASLEPSPEPEKPKKPRGRPRKPSTKKAVVKKED